VSKTLCVFSDGTGQGGSARATHHTHVFRLYQATHNIDPDHQVCFYDPGLGSAEDGERFGWLRTGYNFLSKAIGLGISRNIKDCYDFLIRTFEPGDRLFLFGFSRGAYTVRSLGGVLRLCGIPVKGSAGALLRHDTALRAHCVEEAIEKVYKTYGQDEATREKRRVLGDAYRTTYASAEIAPTFIGVWDTVRALGLPGTSGLVGWRHAFHDASLDTRVTCARQALAIDESRDMFRPVLWEEIPEDRETGRIKQVWFSGVHSDIGGGYHEQGLADITLDWMIRELEALPDPLHIDLAHLALRPDPLAPQHDERRGLGRVWTKGVRALTQRDALHIPSVRSRALAPAIPTPEGYRPYRPEGLNSHPSFREWVENTITPARVFSTQVDTD
jgi:uncharacterized protein (DUF2235 family)